LFFDVTFNHPGGNAACGSNVIRARPQIRQPAIQVREFPTQNMRRVPFDAVHDLVGGNSRWKRAKQMNVVGLNNEFDDFTIKLFRFCVIRAMAISDSGACRSLVPAMPIALYGRCRSVEGDNTG
jgi:hypothetical protein